MSDENTARYAECRVEFNGTDITSSIMPYLLSLSFIMGFIYSVVKTHQAAPK